MESPEKIIESFETDEELESWRSWLRNRINQCIVEVKFQKKDGSIRILKGTTNLQHIPEDKQIKEDPDNPKPTRKVNKDEVCTIFDLESNGWRSFNYSNVIEVRTDIPLTEVNFPKNEDTIQDQQS